MPDLEMLIREARPAPDPAWAAKLDARVAARFPKPTPAWKKPLIAFREHFIALSAVATVGCALLAFVLVVGQNVGGDDDDGGSGGASAPVVGIAEESATDSDSGGSAGAAPPSGEARRFGSDGRAVLSSATLTLSTTPDKVNTVSDRAIRVVDGLGGYVQTSRVDVNGNQANAMLVVKIPSAKLDAGLGQLSKLAHVKGRSQQDEDVTDQREMLEARLRDARADRDGLRRGALEAARPARPRVPPRHAAHPRPQRARAGRVVRDRRARDRRRPPRRRHRAARPLDAGRRDRRRRARARGDRGRAGDRPRGAAPDRSDRGSRRLRRPDPGPPSAGARVGHRLIVVDPRG
jgi:hypothetical protein